MKTLLSIRDKFNIRSSTDFSHTVTVPTFHMKSRLLVLGLLKQVMLLRNPVEAFLAAQGESDEAGKSSLRLIFLKK